MSAVLRVLFCLLVVACSGGSDVHDAQPVTEVDASLDAPADSVEVDTTESMIEVDRTQAVSGVEQVTVTVTLRDAHGVPLAGVDVQLMATGSSNVFSQAPPTDAAGKTSATWSSTLAEVKTVSAVVGGVAVNGPVVTFSPGPATKLGFTQQPMDVIAGAAFTPAVRVEAQDAFGNLVDTTTGYVVLSLEANPGATSLRGSTFATLQNGAAEFAAVHVDVAAMNYSLRAQSSGLTNATSNFFNVAWGVPAPANSSIVAAPHSLEANGVDTTQVTFHVANAYGVALSNVSVSLSVSGSNNMLVPTSGTTDSKGDFRATLSSTTAEMKIVTGTDGMIFVMGSVNFYPPSCTPMLPGKPTTAIDDYVYAIHVADIDGDGVRDTIVALQQQIAVFMGNGDGTFDPPIYTTFSTAQSVNDIKSGDFNGDSHMDLVLAVTSTNALTIMLGAGNGQFTTLSTPLPSYAQRLAVADFNLDSRADVITAVGPNLVVELGVGNGTFTQGGTINRGAGDLAVIDANRDGKPDVILSGSPIATAIGNGDGTFQTLKTVNAPDGLILTGDFNNDMNPDVGVASIDGTLTPLLGDGTGAFTKLASIIYRDPGPQAFMASGGGVRDLDGDGNADIVVGAGGVTSILKGTGTGSFTRNSRFYAATWLMAEMTGDAYADAVGIVGRSIVVVAGTSSAAFVAPLEIYHRSTDFTGGRLYDTVADFDGNGRLDYVRFRSNDPTSAMCVMLTQQDGSVVQASTVADATEPYDAVAGDFTGDGTKDLAIVQGAVTGVTLSIAAGNGTGALAPFTSQNLASPYTTRLAGGDFDQDGRQDLVLYRDGYADFAIVRSTGSAFGPPQSYSAPAIRSLLVADVSQDGVPDVIVAAGTGFSAELRVYRGTGTGGLMPALSYGTFSLTGAIAVGDLTSDGIPDLVFLEAQPMTAQRNVLVYPGLGGGSFGNPIVTPNVRIPKLLMYERLHVFDITGDGNADLVVHSTYGTSVIGGYGDGYVRQRVLHYAVGHIGGAGAGSPIDPVVVSDHDGNSRLDLVFLRFGLYIASNVGCVP